MVSGGVPTVAQYVKWPGSLLMHKLSPSLVQWIKDPVMPQLQHRFNPWPGNFHVSWVGPKSRKRKWHLESKIPALKSSTQHYPVYAAV